MDNSTGTSNLNALLALMNALGKEASGVMVAVAAFAYAAAIYFLVVAILDLVKAADPSARHSHVSKAGWAWGLLTSVLLFALPETLSLVGNTFFPTASTSPLDYSELLNGRNMAAGSCKLGGLLPLLKLYGFIVGIRGLFVMRDAGRLGSHSREHATPRRAFLLLVSGTALIHMQALLGGISALTGLQLGTGLC